MSSVEDNPQPYTAKDKFTFLKELTSEKHHHGETTFYQHLFNVYSYLKSQSCPPHVCDAGLFHAIYGTQFFSFESDVVTRDVVRSYIGEYAEELVHIFCSLKKERFRSIVTNTPARGARQFLDLLWLEYANAWDHKEYPRAQKKMEILSQVMTHLTNEMREYDELTFGNGRDDEDGRAISC